jgi:hypothetical protein
MRLAYYFSERGRTASGRAAGCQEVKMKNRERQIELLNHDVESIVSDTERFLKDLKGQKRVKGSVRQDMRHLRSHLHRLVTHLHGVGAEPQTYSRQSVEVRT